MTKYNDFPRDGSSPKQHDSGYQPMTICKKNDPIYIKKSTVQKGGAIMQPPPLGSNECLGRGE